MKDPKAGARAKLGLSPLEETALQQSNKSTVPVGKADLPQSKALAMQELIGKLSGQ